MQVNITVPDDEKTLVSDLADLRQRGVVKSQFIIAAIKEKLARVKTSKGILL